MDKNLCRQIDQESLVEQYVAGKLRGKLLEQFEQHIKDCEDHARAVSLEKALKRGVSEFARGEIKTKLRNRLKKREDTRFMIFRYAAILFIAVITPLLLYYQLNVAPEEMAESVSEKEERVISDDAIDGYEEELIEMTGTETPGAGKSRLASKIKKFKFKHPQSSGYISVSCFSDKIQIHWGHRN